MSPEKYYQPLLSNFCQEIKKLGVKEDYANLFLPQTMSNYHLAQKKVFYFGQNTYGWGENELLTKSYDNENLGDYVRNTAKWINDFGFINPYKKGKSSAFWILAMQLHLRLKGFPGNMNIGPNMLSEHRDNLKDFGWGNTNAIEICKTQKKRNKWEKLKQEHYWTLKGHSRVFDNLNHTIEIYNPDIVFVFKWDCDKSAFLKGLNATYKQHSLINNHFEEYYIAQTNTRVFWTLHPTAARWKGYGVNKMADEIISFINIS